MSFETKMTNFFTAGGEYVTNNSKSVGFSGGYMTAFRKFTEENLIIIFLSNGYKYFHVEDRVIDNLADIITEKLIEKKLWADEAVFEK